MFECLFELERRGMFQLNECGFIDWRVLNRLKPHIEFPILVFRLFSVIFVSNLVLLISFDFQAYPTFPVFVIVISSWNSLNLNFPILVILPKSPIRFNFLVIESGA